MYIYVLMETENGLDRILWHDEEREDREREKGEEEKEIRIEEE